MKPIPVRVELCNVYKKYIPAICVNHDEYKPGYYARRIEVNREDLLQIIPPCNSGYSIPTLEEIIKTAGNPLHIGVPQWTMEALEGFMVFGTDLISNTGLHNVEYTKRLEFDIWQFCRIFDAIPKLSAGRLEAQLKNLVKYSGLAYVFWYVNENRLYRAWILKRVQNYSYYARISWDQELDGGYQQGNLVLYPIDPKFLGVKPSMDTQSLRRLYHHTFECSYYLRWFSRKAKQAQAIAYLTGSISAADHPPLVVPSGWYLLVHPQPTKDVD